MQPARKTVGKINCLGSDYYSSLPFLPCGSGSPCSWLNRQGPGGWLLSVLSPVHWALGAAATTPRHLWRMAGMKWPWWPSAPLHLPALGKSTTWRHKFGVTSLCRAASPEPQLLQKAQVSQSSMLSSIVLYTWKCIYLLIKIKHVIKTNQSHFLFSAIFLY